MKCLTEELQICISNDKIIGRSTLITGQVNKGEIVGISESVHEHKNSVLSISFQGIIILR